MFTKTPIIIVALSVILSHCNQNSDQATEVSSLDNFTGSRNLNTCGPTSGNLDTIIQRNAFMIEAPSQSLTSELAAGIQAIPLPLRVILTDDSVKTRFVASNAAVKTYCASSFSSPQEQNWFEDFNGQITSCFVKENGKPLKLYFLEDKNVIRHQIVRLSTYVYTQLIQPQMMDAASKSPNQSQRSELVNIFAQQSAQRKALGDVFLDELFQSGNQQAYQRINQLAKADPEAFEHYMFAETIDSYHCSSKSKETFQRMFPKTYQQFVTGPNSLRNETGLAWHEL